MILYDTEFSVSLLNTTILWLYIMKMSLIFNNFPQKLNVYIPEEKDSTKDYTNVTYEVTVLRIIVKSMQNCFSIDMEMQFK